MTDFSCKPLCIVFLVHPVHQVHRADHVNHVHQVDRVYHVHSPAHVSLCVSTFCLCALHNVQSGCCAL